MHYTMTVIMQEVEEINEINRSTEWRIQSIGVEIQNLQDGDAVKMDEVFVTAMKAWAATVVGYVENNMR
jgi:hypothetical protein